MTTIDQIKTHNQTAGFFYFSPSTMRFFNSRVSGEVHEGPGGIYFVTSERFEHNTPRHFTVRKYDPTTGRIYSASEFRGYKTRNGAHARAEVLAQGGG